MEKFLVNIMSYVILVCKHQGKYAKNHNMYEISNHALQKDMHMYKVKCGRKEISYLYGLH